MNNLLIFIVLLNSIYLTTGQKSQKANGKDCKLNKDADTCLMHLLLLGDPGYIFPQTNSEMTAHCRLITNYEKCIKDYSSNCLQSFPRQVTNVLAYGVAKTNKGYCTNKKRKDSFIAIGKCANKIKHIGDNCMKQFIDNLRGTENYPEVNTRLPMACCNFYQMKGCILSAVEKEGKELCPESNYNEIETLIDGYSVDVLNLICGDYTEESDKCVKLLPKTPKKLNSQKRSKSMLIPFINILNSVPPQ